MTEEIIRRRCTVPDGATGSSCPGAAAPISMPGAPFRRAGRARPRRDRGPAGLSRARAAERSTFPTTTCASSPRSSTPRAAPQCDPRARTAMRTARRRRDRSRRPARHAVSAPRGGVRLLKAAGFKVSVDSVIRDELDRGAGAGADYLLSLDEENLDLAFETQAMPGPRAGAAGDLTSLDRAMREAATEGPAISGRPDARADPFRLRGIDRALCGLAALEPDVEMLMGTGNLTELTEADSPGDHGDADGHVFGTCASAMCSSCRSARTPDAPSRSTMRPAA